MKRIYQAANNVEAHMIVHLLGQTGIRAHIEGEHLQSGAGELPLGNLVAVAVADEDADAARAVVREWEARSGSAEVPTSAPTKPVPQVAVLTFFIGALLGAVLMWLACSGPQSQNACCGVGTTQSSGQR